MIGSLPSLLVGLAVIVGAPAAGVPETERANALPKVVVLDTVVTGDIDGPRQQELVDALRSGLSRGEFELVPAPASVECAPEPGKPWSPACAAAAASAVGADFAVSMTIAVDRRDYDVGLEVVDADTAEISGSSSERCEVCGIAEARDVVDSQAAAIRTRIESLTLAPPSLSFTSTPPGALIRVDGKVVGETPFERVLDPGPHRVEASLDGYVSETQNIDAVTGVSATVEFGLEPVPRTVRFRKLRIFGWSALGVGIAGVVTGTTLIALDGRPNQIQCDGSNVDPDGDCKFLYGTLSAGIGTAVVGGVLLFTGIGIIAGTRDKERRASGRKARVQPTFAPGPGRASFGLRGRF